MTTSHFITWLKLALNRNKDFDHLHNARQQFITALQLVYLVGKARLQRRNGCVKVGNLCFNQLLNRIILNSDLLPL